MLFNSYQFIFLYLPLVLVTCFLLARHAGPGAAQLLLIAASIGFYAAWNVIYVPLLLGSITLNYLLARRMIGESNALRRRALLVIAIAIDLAPARLLQICQLLPHDRQFADRHAP